VSRLYTLHDDQNQPPTPVSVQMWWGVRPFSAPPARNRQLVSFQPIAATGEYTRIPGLPRHCQQEVRGKVDDHAVLRPLEAGVDHRPLDAMGPSWGIARRDRFAQATRPKADSRKLIADRRKLIAES
jgi:hypothetical protein